MRSGIILMLLIISTAGTAAENPIPGWADGYPLYEVYIRSATAEGTFAAFERTLPVLRKDGIPNLWLMPIHPIGVKGRKGSLGCPYSTRDYFKVNPEYGTEEDFRLLVDSAHKQGMRVIIDMVANHCANDYVEMNSHPDWFAQDSEGNFTREVADWSDVTDWNFDNPGAVEYLEKAMVYWVKEFDIDGYRCDVAGMVPDSFWNGVIPKLKAVKPEVFMLAEWESVNVHKAGFHATYDWNLYHRMVLQHEMNLPVDTLWQAIEWREKDYPQGAESLKFIENHDQERAYSVFGDDYKPYAALIFTLPGIPLIYNGQEIGAVDKPSLFEREPIKWAVVDCETNEYYRKLLKLRNDNEVLRKGDLKRIETNSPMALAFTRTTNQETILVVINFSDKPEKVKLQGIKELPKKMKVLFDGDVNRKDKSMAVSIDNLPEIAGMDVMVFGVVK